jgi:hypothetical protein
MYYATILPRIKEACKRDIDKKVLHGLMCRLCCECVARIDSDRVGLLHFPFRTVVGEGVAIQACGWQ